jgi:hypothetical protein
MKKLKIYVPLLHNNPNKKKNMASNNAGSCKYVMQDARAFTDYSPNCQMNEYVKNKYAPGSSSEYRMFLQRNGCSIMKELRERNGFVNPSGCNCNFSHPPHSQAETIRYSWQPSATYLANKYSDFNQPIMAPGGKWSNYC